MEAADDVADNNAVFWRQMLPVHITIGICMLLYEYLYNSICTYDDIDVHNLLNQHISTLYRALVSLYV